MAEGEKSDNSGGSWWGSWIASAKEQTEKAFEMVSQDLTEFTSTMQSDTKKVVDKTKETLQANEGNNKTATDKMKQSFHSLMEGITKVLTVEPEDTSPPKSKMSQPTSGIFDRAKARQRAIQVDTGTYLREPSGPGDLYASWLLSFDLDNHKGEISDLLVTMVEVRSLYTSLVPSEVSHQDFWRRYFYKLHQLQVDEARKQALMKRADRANVKEDSISWDEEESWSGDEDAGSSSQKHRVDTKVEEIKREDPTSRLQPEGTSSLHLDSHGAKEPSKQVEEQFPGKEQLQNKVTANQAMVEAEAEHTKEVKETITDIQNDKKSIKSENQPVKEVDSEFDNKDIKVQSETACDNDTDKVKENSNTEKIPEGKVIEQIPDISEVSSETTTENSESKQAVVADVEVVKSEDGDITACDKTGSVENKEETTELKTKVKGDMVVVGDRISPSSESSGNKDSSNDDWEQDFDVDITPEDLAAASKLAQKMNMSAAEYNTLTGGEAGEDDDWENWD